jgi:hypothetical protein
MWKFLLVLAILGGISWVALNPTVTPIMEKLFVVKDKPLLSESQIGRLEEQEKKKAYHYFLQSGSSGTGSGEYYPGGSYRSWGYFGGFSGGK